MLVTIAFLGFVDCLWICEECTNVKMPCVHPLHLHKGHWCVSAPILCRCAWKSLPKSSHCDLFGRFGCTARLSSNLSVLIRVGLGGFSPLRCPCWFLRKLASLWRLWLCISHLCQRFSLLNIMLWYMAGIQLAEGRPSVTSQPGVPLGTQRYSQFSSESVPKVWMKMFRRSRCSRSWRTASFTTTNFVRVQTWWLHEIYRYFWSDGGLNHRCTIWYRKWS
jgi:hypothetical protein